MKTRNLILGSGLLLLSLLFHSCGTGIVGNGDVQTRTQSIGDFDHLEISGNFNVILDQTGSPGIRIEADENILDIIKVQETGNKLEIYSEGNILRARKKNIYINFDDFRKLELSGAIELRAEDKLMLKSFEITGGGAADVRMELEADFLMIDISGVADFDLKGKVKGAELRISGAGGFDLLDLQVDKMDISISGAARAQVYVLQELDVEISGAGSVRYRGTPEINRNVSGIGSLKRY